MMSRKPWQPELVLLFGGLLLLCWSSGLCAVGMLHHAGVAGFRNPDDFGNALVMTLCFQGMTWLMIPFFLRRHQMRWRDAFGYSPKNILRSLALAAAVLVVVVPLILLLENFSALVLDKMGWPVEDQAPVKLVMNARTLAPLIYLGFFAIVMAPVAEEFVFRGVLYPSVKQLGWPKLAWFGVNALFALIHFDAARFLPLFALALVLTWLYEFTDSLLAPIAAHSLFNTVNFVILLLQK